MLCAVVQVKTGVCVGMAIVSMDFAVDVVGLWVRAGGVVVGASMNLRCVLDCTYVCAGPPF